MKVIVTGASGVLGRAVCQHLLQIAHIQIIPLSFSRTTHTIPNLPLYTPLDLLSTPDVQAFFSSEKAIGADWLIHCAAERRPDVAEKDPAGAQKLNAEVPGHLAALSKKLGFTLVYISTDYVFDGTSPPYTPSSITNPVNLYGTSKRDGEVAVLGVEGAKIIVLRVPVLYGPAAKNSDSAINILLDIVQDQSGKTYKMDHYATRYPTNVEDIAGFLVRLTGLKRDIPPIVHYSSEEPYTKYEICLVFAKILGLPHAHIVPDENPPTGAGATTRPRDCHLYTKETQDLGDLALSLFEEWWTERLSPSSSH